MLKPKYALLLILSLLGELCLAQAKMGIYVDKEGVIRWESNHKEAAFFGTNYTVPFAYGYRAVKRVGQTPEQAIKDDVYHFSRLGFDAFRVHVWDQEISDEKGNLLDNEQLRLFDFLIAELKKRKIKTLVTPIAFWGNGYPEQDENTGSFSYKYGKLQVLVEEEAFKAQENYLKQFFKHKNPYTGLTYQQDTDIIAAEVNNEPKHSGAKEQTTAYVNRMVAAMKSVGWTKPIFYNISESPWYADAVVKANVEGHSFQWYPTGLVAGHTLQGNYLPNVAKYEIPFDTIPAFKKRAKIVYEFDAGDVMTPIMYPAMAKSFRAAGFQWATQFAYDPLATAHANTEYQTHYLNLAYTPSKAISMLIASKVFHQVKRGDSSAIANPFKIDYRQSLSEMNSETEFYYTNSTSSLPVTPQKLKHLAGVGSSKLVKYQGTGAYFIDQIENGSWRLEVMPDAIQIKDPFEKASPNKTVTAINWRNWPIEIQLPNLGDNFNIQGLNQGNNFKATAVAHSFKVSPGVYLLAKHDLNHPLNEQLLSSLRTFVAPPSMKIPLTVIHQPLATATQHTILKIEAKIVGLDAQDSVFVQLGGANRRIRLPLEQHGAYAYEVLVPAKWVTSGLFAYQIMVKKGQDEYVVFPANEKVNPRAWDFLETAYYSTYIAEKGSMLEIFNANRDGKAINIYNPNWKDGQVDYPSGENPTQLNLKLSMTPSQKNQLMGFQSYFGDHLLGRTSELDKLTKLVIRVKANTNNTPIKLGLIDSDGHFFATVIHANQSFQTVEVPLQDLKVDAPLLLPRPYPGFLSLYGKVDPSATLKLADLEKLAVTFGSDASQKPLQIFIENVYLK